jgi:hypothetical protein
MQPRLRNEGCQVSRGRYENLGIRLDIGQGILESEQDLHGGIDGTDTTVRTGAAVIAEFPRNCIRGRHIGPKSGCRQVASTVAAWRC